LRRILRGGTGIVAVLLIWQVMSQLLDLDLLLPPPLTVLTNVVRTLALAQRHWLYGPNIYVHLLHSFLRAMAGFAAAAALAIPMGLMLGRLTTLREFVLPCIKGVYPIPGIAWIPLAILWFGLGDAAVVFVVFATTFFPLFFSTEAGSRLINPTVLDAGRCFGARGIVLFFRVILPATVPYIITGLRISLGGAWRMIVAGEMLASQDGIGYVLMESRFQFRAVDLMTAMILIAIVGYATEKLLVDTLEKRTLEKWEVKPS
jgi:ABC-type nitrate/sulfonate/bicarbonate transport system permease component